MSLRPRSRCLAVLGLVLLLLASFQALAQVRKQLEAGKPGLDLADVRYGPDERNVLDLWLATRRPESSRWRPLVIFFHGGGFLKGDKSSVPAWLVTRCLERGISVATANYRLSTKAPYPAPMLDGARAVQFLRLKSAELGIDPDRIAACGNSAGAGISLWVGFHDDLADLSSPDPVSRQSSRLACMGVVGAQTSYDPRFIKQRIGGRAHEHIAIRPLFGVKSDSDLDSPATHALFEQASPVNHVSRDDPPAILFYSEPRKALAADARPGYGIHHLRFGQALKEKLDPLGIECVVRHSDEYAGQAEPEEAMYRDLVDFLASHLDHPDRTGRADSRVGP